MPRSESGKTEPESLGDELRRLRLDKGWSLGDLHHATRRSVSVPYASRLERSGALPRPEMLEVIAEALGADLGPLMRQRDKEDLLREGIDPEVAELALTLRELDDEHTREVVGKLADALGQMEQADRHQFLATLEEAIELRAEKAGDVQPDPELAGSR